MILILKNKQMLDTIDLKLNWLAFNLEGNAKRNLLDLHVHSENFVKDLLNRMCDTNFINLNEERSNEPGIDLADKDKGIAIQVTTQKSKNKIEKTLKKVIDHEHSKTYKKIIILILGKKQSSITIDKKYSDAPLNFDKDKHILGITEILNKIHTLEEEPLTKVFNFINQQIMDIYDLLKIDPGSILSNIEKPPKYTFTNCNALLLNHEKKAGKALVDKDKEKKKTAVKKMYDILYKLSTPTRELFCTLVQHAEYESIGDALLVNEAAVDNIFRSNIDLYKKHLSLLEHENLITKNVNDIDSNLFSITLQGYARTENCLIDIQEFVEDMELNPEDVYINLNFSSFSSKTCCAL